MLLVPRHENDYASVGTVAEVTDRVRLPGGGRAVALNGLHRGVIGAAETDAQGILRVQVEERPDSDEADARTRELEREYRATVEEILELRGDDGRISAFVRSISDPGALADTVGYSPDFSFEQKVKLLETLDIKDRLTIAIELQRERLAEMQVRRRIRDDVEEGAAKQQREYILRARWSRFARSSARTMRPSWTSTAASWRRPSCPSPSASRPSVSSPGSNGKATARPRPR